MKRDLWVNGIKYTYTDTWTTLGRIVRVWCANALVPIVASAEGEIVDSHLVGDN